MSVVLAVRDDSEEKVYLQNLSSFQSLLAIGQMDAAQEFAIPIESMQEKVAIIASSTTTYDEDTNHSIENPPIEKKSLIDTLAKDLFSSVERLPYESDANIEEKSANSLSLTDHSWVVKDSDGSEGSGWLKEKKPRSLISEELGGGSRVSYETYSEINQQPQIHGREVASEVKTDASDESGDSFVTSRKKLRKIKIVQQKSSNSKKFLSLKKPSTLDNRVKRNRKAKLKQKKVEEEADLDATTKQMLKVWNDVNRVKSWSGTSMTEKEKETRVNTWDEANKQGLNKSRGKRRGWYLVKILDYFFPNRKVNPESKIRDK